MRLFTSKKQVFFLFVLSLILLLGAGSVLAAENGGILGGVFEAIGGKNFDMARLYSNYGSIIDLIIYSLVFVGVAQAGLGKRFEGRGGKAVVGAIGVALAIGLSVWGSRNNFNLASFGWLGGVVFMFIMFYAIYHLVKSFVSERTWGNTAFAGALAFVIVYYAAMMVSKPLVEQVHKIPVVGPLLEGAAGILLIVVLVWLGMKLIPLFKGLKSGGSGVTDEIRNAAADSRVGLNEERDGKSAAKAAENTAKDLKEVLNLLQESVESLKKNPEKQKQWDIVNDLQRQETEAFNTLAKKVKDERTYARNSLMAQEGFAASIVKLGKEILKQKSRQKKLRNKEKVAETEAYITKLENYKKDLETDNLGAIKKAKEIGQIDTNVVILMENYPNLIIGIHDDLGSRQFDSAINKVMTARLTVQNIETELRNIIDLYHKLIAITQKERIDTRKEKKAEKKVEKEIDATTKKIDFKNDPSGK